MKLFPFVLVVPAVGRLVRHDLHRDLHRDGQRYSGADHRTGRQAALRFLLSCLLATVAGAALALLTGRSWLEFWHKIVVQFQSQAYLMNSVSLSQLLLAAGVSSAAARGIWAAAAWAALLIETIRFEDREDQTGVRRGWFVALAGIGLAVHTWFNYYAVAALLLVPVFARRHRVEGAAICAALAASTLLPDFDDPALRLHRGLLLLKIVPYVYLAVRFLLEEAAPRRFGRRARRAAIVALVLLVAATAAEGWRGRAVRRLDDEIGRCLERRDLSGAVAAAHQQVRLAPRSVACRLNLGIALATDGRSAEAGEQFLRAVALDRNDSFARRNYGHWLRQSGRAEEAVRELQAASALVPWDDGTWVELARAQQDAGDVDAAAASSARARELRPENPGARTGE
jgi:tetratricopeptide (TPR) repeat protein